MNKKGLIAVIVVIILVIVGYMVWGGSSSTVSNSGTTTVDTSNVPAGVTKDTYAPVTKDTADTTLMGRLKSVSVSAAETGSRVALVNGKASFSNEGVKGTIALGDVAVSKTVGGVNYVIATLAVNSGAPTPYQYAVLFQDNGSSLADKSYALIGSGATIKGVRADEVQGGFVVTVTYTLPTSGSRALTKILVVENGEFNSAKELNL